MSSKKKEKRIWVMEITYDEHVFPQETRYFKEYANALMFLGYPKMKGCHRIVLKLAPLEDENE